MLQTCVHHDLPRTGKNQFPLLDFFWAEESRRQARRTDSYRSNGGSNLPPFSPQLHSIWAAGPQSHHGPWPGAQQPSEGLKAE